MNSLNKPKTLASIHPANLLLIFPSAHKLYPSNYKNKYSLQYSSLEEKETRHERIYSQQHDQRCNGRL